MSKSVIIFLLLFICNIFCKGHYELTDSEGNVSYIEFYEDFNDINEMFDSSNSGKYDFVNTIIITDFEKSKNFGKNFPILLQFFKENSQKLNTLMFINTEETDGDLEIQELRQVLQSVKNSPLKQFSWEYQDEIDDLDICREIISDSLNVLSRIEKLSFKGTEFDDESFFIPYMKFNSLKSLDLSYTDLSEDMFNEFLSKENAPLLTTLKLDGIDMTVGDILPLNNPLPELRTLSIVTGSLTSRNYQNLINEVPKIFTSLNKIRINKEYDDEGLSKIGRFLVNSDHQITSSNLGNSKEFLLAFPNIDPVESFAVYNSQDQKTLDQFFKNIEICPQIIFSNLSELNDFVSKYKFSKRKMITLVSPQITKSEVEFIFNNKQTFTELENIFLVGTSCTSDEIKELRLIGETFSIRLHLIDNPGSLISPNNIYFNNFMHDMWFQMQFQQQMQNIQQNINIPKF